LKAQHGQFQNDSTLTWQQNRTITVLVRSVVPERFIFWNKLLSNIVSFRYTWMVRFHLSPMVSLLPILDNPMISHLISAAIRKAIGNIVVKMIFLLSRFLPTCLYCRDNSNLNSTTRIYCTNEKGACSGSLMAINHQRQHGPAITTGPSAAQVRCSAPVWCRSHGWQSLYSWSEANRKLLHLPASELEDPLHRVLVEPKKAGNGPVSQ